MVSRPRQVVMTRNIVGTGSDSARDDTVSGCDPQLRLKPRAARSQPTTEGPYRWRVVAPHCRPQRRAPRATDRALGATRAHRACHLRRQRLGVATHSTAISRALNSAGRLSFSSYWNPVRHRSQRQPGRFTSGPAGHRSRPRSSNLGGCSAAVRRSHRRGFASDRAAERNG